MSGLHSVFAPSKSSVWANCYGALALLAAANLPDEQTNIHAASGTLTHKCAERMFGGDMPKIGEKHNIEGFDFVVDEDRIERAAHYVNAVRARGGMQFYEQKMSSLPWPGTGDVVIIQLEEQALEAHDLKDGNGIVFANCEQLICYLLLAWKEFDLMCDFQTFRGYIHQPKKQWADQVTYTRAEMEAHLERLTRAYRRGADLIGETPNRINAALTPGEHCEKGWCRMRGTCSARRREAVRDVELLPATATELNDADLGALLAKRAGIEAFFNSLFAEAFNRAKAGAKIPGWKLSTGREGNRAWTKGEKDEEKIGELLYEAIEVDAYEKSLISPTTAQKKLKKHVDTWQNLQQYIHRSPAQPTLVPEADGRLAISMDVPEFENVFETGADLL